MVGLTGPLDLEAYLAIPHLLLSITGDLHGLVDERLAELGHSRRALAAVSHFPTMPFILKRRRSLANVPELAAHYFAATYGLEISQPPLASPDFEVSLAWHVRTDADPALQWFRDLVSDLVRDLAETRVL